VNNTAHCPLQENVWYVDNSPCANSCINPYVEYFSHRALKYLCHLLQIHTEHHHSNYIKNVLVSNLLQCFTSVNKVSSSSGYSDVQHGYHICKCSLVTCFTVAVCTTVQGVFTVNDWYYWEHLSWIVGHMSTEEKNSTSFINEPFLYQCSMFPLYTQYFPLFIRISNDNSLNCNKKVLMQGT
jgi:hypothetical protein